MTQTLILEVGTNERQHRQRLAVLSASAGGTIRVASAYVTDRDFFNLCEKCERRLLTSLNEMDIASGATSLESLRSILESGVAVRILPAYPRFHAKTYIFGDSAAVVTSANLTRSALESNIEVGAELSGAQVGLLCKWFDALWDSASVLTCEQLSDIATQTVKLRREYVKFKAKTKQSLKIKTNPLPKKAYADSVSALFDSAERFFVINTNRRYDYKTSTGGFGLEEKMNELGLATAWENFKFPSHMEQVEAGDAIFAFAKGVGIIGIGVATAGCEVRDETATDRLRVFDDHNAPEWRVMLRLYDPDHNFTAITAQMDLETAEKLQRELAHIIEMKRENPAFQHRPQLYDPSLIPTGRFKGNVDKDGVLQIEVDKNGVPIIELERPARKQAK